MKLSPAQFEAVCYAMRAYTRGDVATLPDDRRVNYALRRKGIAYWRNGTFRLAGCLGGWPTKAEGTCYRWAQGRTDKAANKLRTLRGGKVTA